MVSKERMEMDEEEKGFVIKDKRSFDDQGELKAEEPPKEEDQPQAKKEEEPEKTEGERPPLPEANFSSLIFSLSSSALLHIGEIADPQTGQTRKDLVLAKHTIDTIAMLKEKTAGNLNDEEGKFLDNILTDLRWRYVKATK
jgi:hypothetical protein